ncbi:Hypothetical Protein XCAW_03380 [Xanthomonas citri subsp. citri Aw12879]|nr:Hypothetical Protein XCAW_03380 [Xanthomonas citri subsp. citri Aw12879]
MRKHDLRWPATLCELIEQLSRPGLHGRCTRRGRHDAERDRYLRAPGNSMVRQPTAWRCGKFQQRRFIAGQARCDPCLPRARHWPAHRRCARRWVQAVGAAPSRLAHRLAPAPAPSKRHLVWRGGRGADRCGTWRADRDRHRLDGGRGGPGADGVTNARARTGTAS